jgi:hypothetical protein
MQSQISHAYLAKSMLRKKFERSVPVPIKGATVVSLP